MDDVAAPRMPLVSAIIPTYGRPRLVLRAVKSALRQTYPNMEVRVVVDGPDAATENSLATIVDGRLRVIVLAEPVGGSEARNVGIRACSGEWIALLDDDDEWREDKIAKQVAAALRICNPYALIFSKTTVRLPHIEYVWPHRAPAPGESMSEYLFTRKGLVCGEAFLQASSYFASKRIFLEVPFRGEQRRFVDTDWLLRASAHPKAEIEMLPEALTVYTMGGDYSGEDPARSTSPDFEYLHRWAVDNPDLFTPRALSFFIATESIPRAARQREPFRVFVRLMQECIVVGSPTLNCIAICVVFWFIPEATRKKFRDTWEQLRRRPPAARCAPPQSSMHGSLDRCREIQG